MSDVLICSRFSTHIHTPWIKKASNSQFLTSMMKSFDILSFRESIFTQTRHQHSLEQQQCSANRWMDCVYFHKYLTCLFFLISRCFFLCVNRFSYTQIELNLLHWRFSVYCLFSDVERWYAVSWNPFSILLPTHEFDCCDQRPEGEEKIKVQKIRQQLQ